MDKKIIPIDHENYDLCNKCNGKCCKSHPCYVWPEDFKEITKESIIKKIGDGYCFDYWEGDSISTLNCWFIRPRVKGNNRLIHPLFHGTCIFFIDHKGCSLKEEDRPLGGKALIPKKKDCEELKGYGKDDCARAWLPYNDIIESVIEELDDGSYDDMSNPIAMLHNLLNGMIT